ncbi:HAMP domain-containing protein, partial [Mycobacterium szulgai]
LLSRLLVRPIRRLEAGTARISAGDYEVTVPVKNARRTRRSHWAFNEMSHNLKVKEELLNEQRREIDRLLLSLMP